MTSEPWLSDCDRCKRYIESQKKNKVLLCYQADYYTPGLIVFCRRQVIWMIEFVLPLEAGEWPSKPCSGYEGRDSKSLHCPYEVICCTRSELEDRLSTVNEKDKETLLWEVQVAGLDVYESLSPRARLALDFVSGRDRRNVDYAKWCYKHRKK